MATNEERREVARNLRETSDEIRDWCIRDWCDTNPYWYVMKCVYGDVKIHDDNELFYRLADLIEPEPERTCKNLAFKEKAEGTKPVYDGICFICSECDAYVQDSECYHSGLYPSYSSKEYQDEIKFSYCPNCGAKVVKNANE